MKLFVQVNTDSPTSLLYENWLRYLTPASQMSRQARNLCHEAFAVNTLRVKSIF